MKIKLNSSQEDTNPTMMKSGVKKQSVPCLKNALQIHFNQTKDDPCPIKFLNEISNNFIIELLNITNSDI